MIFEGALSKFIYVSFLILLFFSCRDEKEPTNGLSNIRYEAVPYLVEEPERFVKMLIPGDNPMTEAGVALGKQLFFDPILSVDSTISCASCHQPSRAFTDGLALSRGVFDRQTTRHSPSLFNVAYQNNGLFGDGRAPDLESLITHPVQDSLEMANDWIQLTQKLQEHPKYPTQYRQAFGINTKSEINEELTAKALAQFLRTLISADTRYDRYKAGLLELTASEDRGRRIFFDIEDGLPPSECGHCHVEPLFTGQAYFNNGLDEVYNLNDFTDPGRGGISGRNGEMGTFRTPSLRNITLTAPYMHDGRFKTLEEVVEHYNKGGHYSENVNPNIRPLNLSARHKADLIAFLHTLTEIDLEEATNPISSTK